MAFSRTRRKRVVFKPGKARGTALVATRVENKAIGMHRQNQYMYCKGSCNALRANMWQCLRYGGLGARRYTWLAAHTNPVEGDKMSQDALKVPRSPWRPTTEKGIDLVAM
jgi:hypothetical protein